MNRISSSAYDNIPRDYPNPGHLALHSGYRRVIALTSSGRVLLKKSEHVELISLDLVKDYNRTWALVAVQ